MTRVRTSAEEQIAGLRQIFDDAARIEAAWKTLGVPPHAPLKGGALDPERQPAFERAEVVRGWVLAAMRTIGNPEAKPESVAKATEIVDLLYAALTPGRGKFKVNSKRALIEAVRDAAEKLLAIPAARREEVRSYIHDEFVVPYRRRYGVEVDAVLFAAAVDTFVSKPRGGWDSSPWKAVARLLEAAGFGALSPDALKTGWDRGLRRRKAGTPRPRHRAR